MKATGITRKVDNLGRIVIPKELRDSFDIKTDTSLEFFVDDGGYIIIGKAINKCLLCGSSEELTEFRSKNLCRGCVDRIKENR